MTRFCSALILTMLACAGQASTLEQLMQEDQLRFRSWLQPAEDIVVGQEVRLVIEIATRRWFAGGTRIRAPEVRNLVIMQRDQFATNLSRQEQGQTWVVQQWHLELYPQVAGDFLLPPLTVELAVNDASAGIVRGSLVSESLGFRAEIPTLLQSSDSWVATPSFTVSQEFDKLLESLVPGDAFTRTISIEATHLDAMMLPQPDLATIPGLSAYPAAPELVNRSNRGQATARRIQSITYVVEQPGQYQLAGQDFSWWNTDTGEVGIAQLTAVKVDAGIGSAAQDGSPIVDLPMPDLRWPIAVACLLMFYLLWRRRRAGVGVNHLSLAQRALRRGDPGQALSQIYQWLNSRPDQPHWLSLRQTAGASSDTQLQAQVEALIEKGFAEEGDPDAKAAINLNKLKIAPARERWSKFLRPPELVINPGSNAGSQKEFESQ